jgi:hypothetical protein
MTWWLGKHQYVGPKIIPLATTSWRIEDVCRSLIVLSPTQEDQSHYKDDIHFFERDLFSGAHAPEISLRHLQASYLMRQF